MDNTPATKQKSKVVFFTLFGLSTALLLVTPVLATALIGFLLDGYFHTKPFLLCILTAVGAIGGIVNVTKLLKTIS